MNEAKNLNELKKELNISLMYYYNEEISLDELKTISDFSVSFYENRYAAAMREGKSEDIEKYIVYIKYCRKFKRFVRDFVWS